MSGQTDPTPATGERTTSETTGAGLLDAVAALAARYAADGAVREAMGKPAWPNNVARDLRALLAETPAEGEGAVKAAALREAADEINDHWRGLEHATELRGHVQGYQGAETLLRDRADRIEAGQ